MPEMAKDDYFSGLSDAICYIERSIPSPNKGLPEEVFLLVSRLTPLVNVDLLIRNKEGHILLTWRDDEIFGSGWHIPGGCVRLGERFADRIKAVAAIELGVNVSFEPIPVGVFETIVPERNNRQHHVSILFDCILTSPPNLDLRYNANSPRAGYWAWHSRCPAEMLQHTYENLLWRS
ncbi:MAG: NUDIX hydrolase [Candidatus Competibacteraceae bacterium]|nr:NUDIX hydrolase [Candidatus Competibacteraceae bacterium]